MMRESSERGSEPKLGAGDREGGRVTGLVAVVQYIAAKERSAMNFFVKPNHDFFLRFVFCLWYLLYLACKRERPKQSLLLLPRFITPSPPFPHLQTIEAANCVFFVGAKEKEKEVAREIFIAAIDNFTGF